MNSFLLPVCIFLFAFVRFFRYTTYLLPHDPYMVCSVLFLTSHFVHFGNSANQMEHRTSRNPSEDNILILWMGSGLFKTLACFLRLLVQMRYPEAGWGGLSKSECLTILCLLNQNSHGI